MNNYNEDEKYLNKTIEAMKNTPVLETKKEVAKAVEKYNGWTYNGRDIVFKCLVGSHNYNLADERSDKDYKVWVAPTLDDMVFNKMISKVSEIDGDDTEYKDIRELPRLLWKSNINFMEVLFSTEMEINPKYQKQMDTLLTHREKIAAMNIPYWYNSARGIALSCKKRIESTKRVVNNDLVDKHGYDTKEAMKSIRVLDFLIKYQKCELFQNSFTYGEYGRSQLLAVKNGLFRTKEDAYEMIEKYEKDTEKLKDWYMSKPQDNDTLELIKKVVKDMCLISIKNDL